MQQNKKKTKYIFVEFMHRFELLSVAWHAVLDFMTFQHIFFILF